MYMQRVKKGKYFLPCIGGTSRSFPATEPNIDAFSCPRKLPRSRESYDARTNRDKTLISLYLQLYQIPTAACHW